MNRRELLLGGIGVATVAATKIEEAQKVAAPEKVLPPEGVMQSEPSWFGVVWDPASYVQPCETCKHGSVVALDYGLPMRGEYQGFQIRWTGWKPDPCSMLIAGQWIATPGVTNRWEWDAAGLVSPSPGPIAAHHRGEMFDLTPQWHQGSPWEWPSLEKAHDHARKLRDHALSLLTSAIVAANELGSMPKAAARVREVWAKPAGAFRRGDEDAD